MSGYCHSIIVEWWVTVAFAYTPSDALSVITECINVKQHLYNVYAFVIDLTFNLLGTVS
jgi:hypothetical protein